MADPLVALRAYGQAARVADPLAGPSAPAPGGPDFGAMVKSAIADTAGSVQAAETMAIKGVTGQAPILDVVTAISQAEMTMETVVSVRDEVVRAYQEILRMPI